MSSILKALEKAEESKSPRRMAGDGGLIRSRTTRPVWVMPVAVLCGAGAAALVTFAAMGGFSRHTATAPAPVAVAKVTPGAVAPASPVLETPAAPPVPAAVARPGAPVGAPQAPGASSVTLAHPYAAPVSKPRSTPASNRKAATPPVTQAAAPAGRPRAAAAAAPERVSAQPSPVGAASVPTATVPSAAVAPTPAATAPQLKVTGIAWQGKGESSFAVVNGRAVLQGGVVDGYKVLEIRQDSVRLSGSGGNIDVPLEGDDK